MTASFEVINGELKITFEYQAATAKVQSLAEDAAHYFWDHGYGDHGTEEEPIVFDDLNNTDKLDLLDQAVKRFLIDSSGSFYVNDAVDVARDTANEEIDERYIE